MKRRRPWAGHSYPLWRAHTLCGGHSGRSVEEEWCGTNGADLWRRNHSTTNVRCKTLELSWSCQASHGVCVKVHRLHC
jgi:hypothetical protein